MSAFSRSPLLDGARAVVLSIALGIILIAFPLLSLLSLLAAPLLPIPAAYVTSRHGISMGGAVVAMTGLLALPLVAMAAMLGQTFYGAAAFLIVILLVSLVGVGAGACLRSGISQSRLYAFLSVSFFVCLLAWIAALVAFRGFGETVQAFTEYVFESSRTFYLRLGMSDEEIDASKALAPYLMPSLLLLFSMLFSGATIGLARRAFDRLRQPFPHDFVLREFRLHYGFAYLMIAGLLCQLGSPYLAEGYREGVSLVGANLMIVSELLFFIQGIAVASYFMWRHQIGGIKKGGIYLCMVLLEIAFSLTSWMGLFDTWLDYRRRFTRKKT